MPAILHSKKNAIISIQIFFIVDLKKDLGFCKKDLKILGFGVKSFWIKWISDFGVKSFSVNLRISDFGVKSFSKGFHPNSVNV